MNVRFPRPLARGDLIAITAPSSGVPAPLHARLDIVVSHLRSLGYRVVEGRCLRSEHKNASAPQEDRAAELEAFLNDPKVTAIFPPWGGELASELLERIDFESLRSVDPKWMLGFSDISTLLMPLTLVSGWATAHGSNMMDLSPTQTHPLMTGVLDVLAADLSVPVKQLASSRYQKQFIDFAVQADAALNLTETTEWQRLDGSASPIDLQGRLIGGCLDTVAWLAGSVYGDVPTFIRAAGADGALLYLENCEMPPVAVVRAMLALKRHGWFEGLSGLLLGRSSGPDAPTSDSLSYVDALRSSLEGIRCPVLYDLDIGHRQPQLTLVNGALAKVRYDGRCSWLSQTM